MDTGDIIEWREKQMEYITKNTGDTVDIIKRIRPIYNFKAGD